jgi:pantetheine-phosphate adenylyltransferase
LRRCAVGGTFEVLHKGHRALLARAFEEGDEVLIGLTTDEMANRSRKRKVRPFEQRERELGEYLDLTFPDQGYEIVAISDELGPAATMRDLDALVVSEGSYRNGLRVNEARLERRLQPVRIVRMPHVLADDGRPISSTRVLAGECDAEGHLGKGRPSHGP